RDGGLDEAAEKVADVAEHEQRDADRAGGEDDAAGVFAVARADAAARERPEHAAPGEADDEDAENDSGEAEVEPHVAVEDVAELVADHALQLVAGELVERAAR